MTQTTVIEVTPQEKEAIGKILNMYIADEMEDCENIEEYAQQGKMHRHIYYALETLQKLYDRLK